MNFPLVRDGRAVLEVTHKINIASCQECGDKCGAGRNVRALVLCVPWQFVPLLELVHHIQVVSGRKAKNALWTGGYCLDRLFGGDTIMPYVEPGPGQLRAVEGKVVAIDARDQRLLLVATHAGDARDTVEYTSEDPIFIFSIKLIGQNITPVEIIEAIWHGVGLVKHSNGHIFVLRVSYRYYFHFP